MKTKTFRGNITSPSRRKGHQLGAHASGLAFTLIELLVVISIIGLLVAIALPTINGIRKPSVMAAATRQLLDDLARARQLAITHRTTVYMVFVPTNFWGDPNFPSNPVEVNKANKLYDKQMISYAFVSLRQLGEQPGRITPRYLSSWKTLPEGVFIALPKFGSPLPASSFTIQDPLVTGRRFVINGFNTTNIIPFPSEGAVPADPVLARNQKYVTMPYLAFNYLGQLTLPGQTGPVDKEIIPLARGTVSFVRNQGSKEATQALPTITENPVNNFSNTFNLLVVDGLTGRAHVERQEVQ